eukprot:NODE_5449_length_1769_cov_5.636419.p1 GENE.NODE_5449_length_1769_cov_5.636419~~NODE_5449_length_1769_cov_5.636419.p1  ORF type:complete len:275 (-),score=53.63 NODE_5449_length_1769_cov_5.636419:816-1640(-)
MTVGSHQQTENGIAKIVLCWSVAVLFLILEVVVHTTCGFEADLLEEEGDCLGFSRWGYLLVVSEALCQATMAIGLVGFAMEAVKAAHDHQLTTYCRAVLVPSHPIPAIMAVSFALLVIALNIWAMAADEEEGVPHGVELFLHFFEFFCNTIVWSFIVGLTWQIVSSIAQGKFRETMLALVTCNDSLESHGIGGVLEKEEKELTQGEQHHQPRKKVTGPGAALMWIFFGVVLAGHIYLETAGDEDTWWGVMLLGCLAIVCSAGIAIAVVHGLFFF